MRGDAARDVNADGGDFALAARLVFSMEAQDSSKGPPRTAPDAGEAADAAGLDAKVGAKADQGLFHKADKVDRAQTAADWVAEAAQIEDRIADELAGP